MEYLYRYTDVYGIENYIELRLDRFEIVKKTQCGAWIKLYGGKKKFILNNTYKKWACATPEIALESFRARKKKQVRILKSQLKRAEAALIADPETTLSLGFELENT